MRFASKRSPSRISRYERTVSGSILWAPSTMISRTKSPDCAAAGQGASNDIHTHQAIAKKQTKRRK